MGESKGLLERLQCSEIVIFAHFLTDVTTVLSKLSLTFQRTDVMIADIQLAIDSTIESLESYATSPGPYLADVMGATEIQGVVLKAGPRRAHSTLNVDSCRQQLIIAVVDQLRDRFRDIGEGVLAATAIGNFRNWPAAEFSREFAMNAIDAITAQFGTVITAAGISLHDVESELTVLRKTVYSRPEGLTKLRWCEIFTCLSETCPNLLGIIQLILALPVHSADCERGFSVMKKVKTDWRASLQEQGLNDNLRVVLLTAEIESFQAMPAIQHWNASGVLAKRPDIAEGHHESSDSD